MRLDAARAHAHRAGQLGRQTRDPVVRAHAKQVVRLTRRVGRVQAPYRRMDRFLRAVELAAKLDSAAYRNIAAYRNTLASSVRVPGPRLHGDSGDGAPAPHGTEPVRPRGHPAADIAAPSGLPDIAAPSGLPDIAAPSGVPDLAAHLLGELRIVLKGQEVTRWSGTLGKSLLKFLLVQRPKPVTRDVLIEAFWPGVASAAAKNRLHVALYSLRADLRRVCSTPVVIHHRNTYTINPELTVWLDTEQFTRLAAAGTALARAGSRDEAIRTQEAASWLYRGDLVEDTLYVEWAAPERERLAATYLDLLAHLACLYFDDGRYTACVDTCRRLLDRDPCREQAHRLVMRSFARLGQPHRAVAQFELCERLLQDGLGMTPDPATVALYESIRAHREV
jgi:DNA-binding SARP family transcriptional activator